MSWTERRRNLLRKELAGLEADVALCERCYGDEERCPARFDRPAGIPRVLILGERPPKIALRDGARLGIDCPDAATRFLRALLEEAEIASDEVLLGAVRLCRPVSGELDRAIPAGACLEECARHVRELVRLAGPRLLIASGAQAVRGLALAFPESAAIASLQFPASVGATIDAGGVWLRCTYHPSARARVARPALVQREDWRAIGRLWRWIHDGEGGRPPSD